MKLIFNYISNLTSAIVLNVYNFITRSANAIITVPRVHTPMTATAIVNQTFIRA